MRLSRTRLFPEVIRVMLRVESMGDWLSQDATRKQVLAAALAFVEDHNSPD